MKFICSPTPALGGTSPPLGCGFMPYISPLKGCPGIVGCGISQRTISVTHLGHHLPCQGVFLAYVIFCGGHGPGNIVGKLQTYISGNDNEKLFPLRRGLGGCKNQIPSSFAIIGFCVGYSNMTLKAPLNSTFTPSGAVSSWKIPEKPPTSFALSLSILSIWI